MKIPVSDFDESEFSHRYVFTNGFVAHIKRPDKFLTPQTQTNPQGRDYHYYRLTDNAGCRRKVSTALASGRVEKVGEVYQLDHWPEGWSIRPGFPSYLFHPEKRVVRRVGFLTPKTVPIDIKPTRHGKYRLHTPEGYRWYHRDDLFR